MIVKKTQLFEFKKLQAKPHSQKVTEHIMADIFLSYARKDKDRIEPLAKALGGQGWSVFWDREIPAEKILRTPL